MRLLLMVSGVALFVVACLIAPEPEIVTVMETVVVTEVVTRDVVVTATPQIPTSTPQPSVILQEDFENEDSGWDTGETESVARFYEEGQYHMLIKSDGLIGWSGHPELEGIEDFILDVDITQVSGPDNNDFGVLFRYQDSDNWYALLISGDGYFKFRKQFNGEDYDITRWMQVTAIKQGQNTNHLQLVAKGPLFSVFVNDELLATVPDNSFRRGDIFLTAGSLAEGNVHVSFDNLVVTELE